MFKFRSQLTVAQWATIRDLCLHEQPRPAVQRQAFASIEIIVIEDDLTVESITVHPDGRAEKSVLNGIGEGWTERELDQSEMEWIEA
ncbi:MULTISPECIES: hypothetical protein [Glutamicibacter]|uniref:hypothetical protein n=1 Tax=Glutamicibacter TaxID=1742989 RepID=UPI00167FC71E|nr:hypothetical protein [Glutamicibacter nicotianae]